MDGKWRGEALTFFEGDGWTLFEGLSGVFGDRATDDWIRLAGSNRLVFASYNDALPYGELIVIEDGRLVRELRDDPAQPSWFRNFGQLPAETDAVYTSWVDIEAFVDSDSIYERQPNDVSLWLFEAR
jgi:hypothetical protein